MEELLKLQSNLQAQIPILDKTIIYDFHDSGLCQGKREIINLVLDQLNTIIPKVAESVTTTYNKGVQMESNRITNQIYA